MGSSGEEYCSTFLVCATVSWLEPGDQVTIDDLVAAEETAGSESLPVISCSSVSAIDVDEPNLDPGTSQKRGVDFIRARSSSMAERRVSLLGSDSNNDCAPSSVEGVAFPVHVLAIHAMGLHLLDYLQLEDLLQVCEQLNRWSFLCVVAPLRLPDATGSPVNPIAIM